MHTILHCKSSRASFAFQSTYLTCIDRTYIHVHIYIDRANIACNVFASSQVGAFSAYIRKRSVGQVNTAYVQFERACIVCILCYHTKEGRRRTRARRERRHRRRRRRRHCLFGSHKHYYTYRQSCAARIHTVMAMRR